MEISPLKAVINHVHRQRHQSEFAIGKKTRLGTIGSMRDMAGRNWTWMGMWMVWVGVAVGFYYAVVMGWTIRYFWVALSGEIDLATDTEATMLMWENFIHDSPLEVVMFQLIAVSLSGIIVYGGIRGIERANTILIPCLVGFLIIAMIYPFILNPSGAATGLRFLFIPQWEYLFKGETWIRALTQSAWSTSAGFGMAITYAVAMKKKEDIALNAFLTGLGNNSVSLIAGVAVLGTIFAMSETTADGLAAVEAGSSGLTFVHLTALFASMPGGRVMGAIFFSALASRFHSVNRSSGPTSPPPNPPHTSSSMLWRRTLASLTSSGAVSSTPVTGLPRLPRFSSTTSSASATLCWTSSRSAS